MPGLAKDMVTVVCWMMALNVATDAIAASKNADVVFLIQVRDINAIDSCKVTHTTALISHISKLAL